MIRAVAVDDEPLALMIIENYCARIEDLDLVRTFSNLKDLQKYINQYPIDILFLDIQISKTNGMEFYKKLENKIPVIFTTAFSNYAVDGFNVSAIDYLLKPIEFSRFEESVNKAKLFIDEKKIPESNNFLSIRADYQLYKINFEDIIFIEGLDDYVKINLVDGKKITARISMKAILDKLPSNLFIRIHRSYIVCTNKLTSIKSKSIFINDLELPIGDTYKNNLNEFLK